MNMIAIDVPVSFAGTVRVLVPAYLPVDLRNELAENLALCQVLATTDNPDAPAEEACDTFASFARQYGVGPQEADRIWDVSTAESVGGDWSTAPKIKPSEV